MTIHQKVQAIALPLEHFNDVHLPMWEPNHVHTQNNTCSTSRHTLETDKIKHYIYTRCLRDTLFIFSPKNKANS